ncbi:hypothetical protein [Leyella stercorea]|uniref:hypothetical protein n=1 Tax=Leyella stercorea TaxID=363265 RepID=UPI002432702D|nr:hypothetical protein [Leyella stercorea]
MVHFLLWQSGKAERRQVHPLEGNISIPQHLNTTPSQHLNISTSQHLNTTPSCHYT